MTSAVPQPLQRVHSRLLQRDAIQMLRERIGPRALFSIATWMARPPRAKQSLMAYAPVTAVVLRHIHAVASGETENFGAILRTSRLATEALFGIGLIAGCHIRDEAEFDSPMPCSISWVTALEALESTSLRHALWSIGLPNDTTAVATLVEAVGRRIPILGLRLIGSLELSHGVGIDEELKFPEAPFLLGLAGAGITLPRRRLPRDME